jgi:GntR family histidine utilization transcriptional repressor
MAGRDTSQSLHERILTELRQKIVSGDWPLGHRLPFELDLARHYGCSRMTVNKVMSQLARSGLVERRRKAGSFVAAPRADGAVLEIRDIRDEVEALGRGEPYRFSTLSRVIRQSTRNDMQALRLSAKAAVLAIDVLHAAGRHPFCREQRLINLAAVPSARSEVFTDIAPGPWLVARIPWTEAEHRIRAAEADKDMATILGIGAGRACLVIERRTWSSGAPVTHVVLTYPAATQELTARFKPE